VTDGSQIKHRGASNRSLRTAKPRTYDGPLAMRGPENRWLDFHAWPIVAAGSRIAAGGFRQGSGAGYGLRRDEGGFGIGGCALHQFLIQHLVARPAGIDHFARSRAAAALFAIGMWDCMTPSSAKAAI
jgi:hypothetical protein